MKYEWDAAKNLQNQKKHEGITFEVASLVFDDPQCLIIPDRIDAGGEHRWHALGSIFPGPAYQSVLLVVHAYRENYHGQEIIRIISARPANKLELRRYQKQEDD